MLANSHIHTHLPEQVLALCEGLRVTCKRVVSRKNVFALPAWWCAAQHRGPHQQWQWPRLNGPVERKCTAPRPIPAMALAPWKKCTAQHRGSHQQMEHLRGKEMWLPRQTEHPHRFASLACSIPCPIGTPWQHMINRTKHSTHLMQLHSDGAIVAEDSVYGVVAIAQQRGHWCEGQMCTTLLHLHSTIGAVGPSV
eukprot:1158156-Pelagomonas_calceolata.AAC.3